MSKKKKKLTKPLKTTGYKILRIDWEDHWSGNGNWQPLDNFSSQPMNCVSVGVKVFESKKVVMLAQNLGFNRTAADTVTILKKCIIKTEELGTVEYVKET